jgi:hypothetical protein
MEKVFFSQNFVSLYLKLMQFVLPLLSPFETEEAARNLGKKIVFEVLYHKLDLFEEEDALTLTAQIQAISDLEWFRLIFLYLPQKKQRATLYLKVLLQMKNYNLTQLAQVCDAPQEWVLEVLMGIFELPQNQVE